MHIVLTTPAPPGSKAGNRATAERWASLLEQTGHEITVVTDYQGEACDLFIALHAWRSHEAVMRFREAYPDTPLIVVLTGTDIYRHQYEYPKDTLQSMILADALIGLHERVSQDIPEQFASKLITLYQSAPLIEHAPAQFNDPEAFEVCVIGHLRDEKDSLRAAMAARLVPTASTLRVISAGKPHNAQWQAAAEQEMLENPRFRWVGELEKSDTNALMTGCRAMVISSVMEGGANVVSEACRAGIPIIASDISGNIGLLGEDYEGYYPVGDANALAQILQKAEQEPAFLDRLREQVSRRAPRFTPESESHALEQALNLAIQRRSATAD